MHWSTASEKINSQEGVRGSVDFCLSKISSDNQTNKNNVPLGYYFTDLYAFCVESVRELRSPSTES